MGMNPLIKVGDRVRVNPGYAHCGSGPGTVARVTDIAVHVTFDNGKANAFYNSSRSLTVIKSHSKGDPVNHPPHYTSGKYEVLDVIEDWGLTKHSHLANVIKYVARHDKKGDRIENLEKARTYLDREIKNAKEGVFQ